MAWFKLTAADYTPDMPALENSGSNNIYNALPKTSNSYGPMPSLTGYAGTLNLACQGAFSCLDSGDNVYLFAGDQKNLYLYTSNIFTPSIVSNGINPYNISPDNQWHFVIFAGRVIATDFESPLQSYVLGSSTSFTPLANGSIGSLMLVAGSGYTNGTYALTVTNSGSGMGFTGNVTVAGGVLSSYVITNKGSLYPQTATISIPAGAGTGTGGSITPFISTIAPEGYYMAIVKNFLCVANTYDSVNGAQPQCVWWSSDNDPTNWPTPGTATAAQFQSSYNNLYGDGGHIQGIVGNLGTADGAIFMEHAVWRMIYAGPPDVFDFYPAEGVRGTPAPGSIVQLGADVYYLGEDGFYVFDGTNSQPIGINRVDKTFYADVDRTNISKISSAADPVNRMIYWAYPGAGNVSGIPNKVLGYNWALDKWTIIYDDNMLNTSFLEYIFRAYTFGNNILDNIGSVSLDTPTYNTFPMDSSIWNGGSIQLGGFLSPNHSLGFFNGQSYTALFETGEKQLFQGRRAQIKNTRPLVDVTPSSKAFVNIGTRDTQQVAIKYNSIAQPINYLGTAPQIANGRYVRSQIQITSGASDTWTEFQGIEVDASESGVM